MKEGQIGRIRKKIYTERERERKRQRQRQRERDRERWET